MYKNVLILSLFGLCLADKIKYDDCGSKAGVVHSVDVTSCSILPCFFNLGVDYIVAINFTSGVSTQAVIAQATGIIDGVPNPVPLDTSDACKKGVRCPVHAKDLDVYKGLFSVPVDEPLVAGELQWELKTETSEEIICIKFPGSVQP